jgi:hypothetical protein
MNQHHLQIDESVRRRMSVEFKYLRERINTMMLEIRPSDPGQANMMARNCFSDISRRSEAILCTFSTMAKRGSTGEQRDEPVAELARYFANFQEYTNELKRTHFTAASTHKLTAYVKHEIANLEKFVPGLARQRTGSELKTAASLGFGMRAGFLSKLFRIGPAIDLKMLLQKRMVTDEDGDSTIFQTFNRTLSCAFQAIFRPFKDGKGDSPDGGKGSGLNFLARFQYHHTKGNYHNHKTIDDTFRTVLKRQHSGGFNLLYRSGDSNCRAAKFARGLQKSANFILGSFAGVKYLPTPGAPNVNEKKLLKGSHNAIRLEELAQRLTTRLPHPFETDESKTLHAITQRAYPPIDLVLSDTTMRANDPGEVEDIVFSSVNAHSPLPTPGNRNCIKEGNSIRQHGFEFEGSASLTLNQVNGASSAQLRPQIEVGLKYEYLRSNTGFLRLKPAHSLLDPAYCVGIGPARALLTKLEEKYRDTPKWNACKNVMLNIRATPCKSYGSGALKNSFDRVKDEIQSLRQDYLALTKLASIAKSCSDKKYLKSLPSETSQNYTDRRNAFVQRVFNIDPDTCNPNEIKFLKILNSDPNRFITESYDALSIAFGAVSIKISEFKKAAAELEPFGQERKDLCNAMTLTDMDYVSLKNVMDGVFLPIDPEVLCRSGALKATSASVNTTHTTTGKGKASLTTVPTDYVPGEINQFPTPPHDPFSAGYAQIRPDADYIGRSIQGSRITRYATDHPSILRDGVFSMTRRETTGIGFAAFSDESLAKSAAKAAAEMKRKGRISAEDQEAINVDSSMSAKNTKWMNQAVNNVFTAGIIGKTNGLESWTCQRQPSPDEARGYGYRKYIQFCRTVVKSGATIGGTVVAPVVTVGAATLAASASARYSETMGDVVHETMGNCPAYQILQFRQMHAVLNMAQKTEFAAADKKAGHRGKLVDASDMDTQCNFAKVRALLAPEASAENQPLDRGNEADANYLPHKWFGEPDTILDVMDEYVVYQKGRRKIGDATPRHQYINAETNEIEPRSLFDQLDDSEEMWRVISAKALSKKTAAGSFAATATSRARSAERHWDNIPLDPRPKLGPEVEDAILAVRKHFDDHKAMTAKQRMEYFFADARDPMPPGRVVFSAYSKIMKAYGELNEDAKNAFRYKTEVV